MINPATLLLSLALAMQAQPAEKPQTQRAETKAAAADDKANDDDKIICKRTAVIGSKFKKRVCATAYEWKTLREQAQQSTREMQRAKGVEPVN